MNRKLIALAALSAATFTTTGLNAQTIGCTVGSGNGAVIPTTGTGGGGTFPGTFPTAPSFATLNVASLPTGATVVTEVKLIGLTHTFAGDLQFVLTAPSGATHNIFSRPFGSCDYSGDYTIVSACTGGFPAGTCPTGLTVVPPGTYDQTFGAWPSGTNGVNNTGLSSIAAATGIWTLTIYDWAAADIGALTSFDVCFGNPVAPAAPTAAPALTTPAANAAVFGPTVNLVWASSACATSYDVQVDGMVVGNTTGNTFAYASSQGSHTWTVRGINASGMGPYAAPRTFNDLGVPAAPCTGQNLTTLFAGGNGLGTNSAVFFDVDVLNPAGITVSQFDTNATGNAGLAFTLEVWTKPGTYVGSQQNAAAWTLTATGGGVTTGTGTPSLAEVPDFALPMGITGFALRIIGAGHTYTNGNGANQFYANSDLSITLGQSVAALFTGTPINPRVWNGTLRYNCAGGSLGSSYCGPAVANTTGNSAVLTATGSAMAAANNVTLTASAMPTNQFGFFLTSMSQGLIMNPGGSQGNLCLVGTIGRYVRMGQIMNAGAGGTFSLALNLTQTPAGGVFVAIGAGETWNFQAWFRDIGPMGQPWSNFTDGRSILFN